MKNRQSKKLLSSALQPSGLFTMAEAEQHFAEFAVKIPSGSIPKAAGSIRKAVSGLVAAGGRIIGGAGSRAKTGAGGLIKYTTTTGKTAFRRAGVRTKRVARVVAGRTGSVVRSGARIARKNPRVTAGIVGAGAVGAGGGVYAANRDKRK